MAQLARLGKSAVNYFGAKPGQRAAMEGLPPGMITPPVLWPGVKPEGQSSWLDMNTCGVCPCVGRGIHAIKTRRHERASPLMRRESGRKSLSEKWCDGFKY